MHKAKKNILLIFLTLTVTIVKLSVMERLDKKLVMLGLAKSRTKAQEMIALGVVYVNGEKIIKDSYEVSDADIVLIKENDVQKYVSRGGLKLEKAIKKFNINLAGKTVLDLGSSTGGFTDCALKHGAVSVLAVDVGTNLMDARLRQDGRVTLREQTNFKELTDAEFNKDYIVSDLSFISLSHLSEKLGYTNTNGDLILLIKPQFECGKDEAKKYKGVVLDKKIHERVIEKVIRDFEFAGYFLHDLEYSPIKGGDGNIEYIGLFKRDNWKFKLVEKIIDDAFENLK